jgi:hypothetical protein
MAEIIATAPAASDFEKGLELRFKASLLSG